MLGTERTRRFGKSNYKPRGGGLPRHESGTSFSIKTDHFRDQARDRKNRRRLPTAESYESPKMPIRGAVSASRRASGPIFPRDCPRWKFSRLSLPIPRLSLWLIREIYQGISEFTKASLRPGNRDRDHETRTLPRGY